MKKMILTLMIVLMSSGVFANTCPIPAPVGCDPLWIQGSNVGVGTATPSSALEVVGVLTITGDTSRITDATSGSFIDLTGGDITLDAGGDGVNGTIPASGASMTWDRNMIISRAGTPAINLIDNGGGGAGKITGGSNDGSTAIVDDQLLLSVFIQGWDTGTTQFKALGFYADADWGDSSTDAPTRIVFFTVPDGSQTEVERLRIDSTGAVIYPPTNVSALVTCAAGTKGATAYITFENSLCFCDGSNYVRTNDNSTCTDS